VSEQFLNGTSAQNRPFSAMDGYKHLIYVIKKDKNLERSRLLSVYKNDLIYNDKSLYL